VTTSASHRADPQSPQCAADGGASGNLPAVRPSHTEAEVQVRSVSDALRIERASSKSLAARVADLERELARLSTQNAELTTALAAARADLAQFERRRQAIVSSFAYRLTRPLRALIRLARTFRVVARGCTPVANVEALGADRFNALSNDPQMRLELESPSLLPGWYHLRGIVQAGAGPSVSRLYVGDGSHFHQDRCVSAPLPPDGAIDEVFEAPIVVRALRFDPIEREGVLVARGLTLRMMTRFEAGWRLAYRHLRHSQGRGLVMTLLLSFPTVRTFLRTGVPPGTKPVEEVKTKVAIVRTPSSVYRLTDGPAPYTYVPPEPPADLARTLATLAQRPRFSIVVPVYNSPPDLLHKAVASVLSQWYPHWQLVLVDDASPSEDTRAALAALHDDRILVDRLPTNRGIAGATNAALERATGDYVVFLDHDDELTPDCLFELARCISASDPDFVYSDEDKLSEAGDFVEPHFKPSWSPDTMMSTMYTCHVMCVRRSLVTDLGGLRSEYDGCQDWDLVLRVTERTDRIAHVPKVLYHWRIIPNSIAASMTAKPYAIENARRLRADTLARRGRAGSVEPVPDLPGYFRVNYALTGEPRVSIIIPTRDNGAVLERCLASIAERSTYRHREVVVIDNGSRDAATLKYLESIRRDPAVRVIRHDAPFNYSELNNLGLKASKGELVLFLNDDTEVVTPDWLERMGGYAQLPHIGAVGAKLCYPGLERVQHAGILNLEDGPGHAFLQQPVSAHGYFARNLLDYNWLAVTGACLMVERKKLDLVGGFDEGLPVAYNDVELCLRLHEAELVAVVCQAVKLIHHESLTRGKDATTPEKLERLRKERIHVFERHPRYYQHDPFYNPNLHPNGINFELAS